MELSSTHVGSYHTLGAVIVHAQRLSFVLVVALYFPSYIDAASCTLIATIANF
jgi:hypothetical protein